MGAYEIQSYDHYDCMNNTWTGTSYVDPRPTGDDKYIDYLYGYPTPKRPSHGHYGRLPITKIQDPTYEEVRSIMESIQHPENEYDYVPLCGFGTTWEPGRKQCIRMQDDYITYDGTGLQYQRPVYPYIRSEGDSRCYDDPDDIYTYLNGEQQGVYTSVPHGTYYCKDQCKADRCRFPLTSIQGQRQAILYVHLFREVYEYSGSILSKLVRRTRMRTLIDNHSSSTAFHGDGIFLPWHRWYILEMETILMQHQEETVNQLNCKNTFVGVPYFDWHNLPCQVTPKDFINHANFHNSLGEPSPPNSPVPGCVGGALAGFVRTGGGCLTRRWSNAIGEVFPEVNLHPLFPLATNYNLFRYQLENGPGLHGTIHGIVGGDMATMGSSNDPLFYVHHANVDKIWHDWQTWSIGHRNSYSGSTPCGSVMPVSTATPCDMLDLGNQVYTPPLGAPPDTINVEYVDMDTSSMMGDGNTYSR